MNLNIVDQEFYLEDHLRLYTKTLLEGVSKYEYFTHHVVEILKFRNITCRYVCQYLFT